MALAVKPKTAKCTRGQSNAQPDLDVGAIQDQEDFLRSDAQVLEVNDCSPGTDGRDNGECPFDGTHGTGLCFERDGSRIACRIVETYQLDLANSYEWKFWRKFRRSFEPRQLAGRTTPFRRAFGNL